MICSQILFEENSFFFLKKPFLRETDFPCGESRTIYREVKCVFVVLLLSKRRILAPLHFPPPFCRGEGENRPGGRIPAKAGKKETMRAKKRVFRLVLLLHFPSPFLLQTTGKKKSRFSQTIFGCFFLIGRGGRERESHRFASTSFPEKKRKDRPF